MSLSFKIVDCWWMQSVAGGEWSGSMPQREREINSHCVGDSVSPRPSLSSVNRRKMLLGLLVNKLSQLRQ
jgi:hypothetical protein